ncbi:unnamed protein product [Sympodiomycopsis kandeliae]
MCACRLSQQLLSTQRNLILSTLSTLSTMADRSPLHPGGHGTPTPSFSARALGRLQIFHPISLLVLIASLAVTSVVTKPNLTNVGRRHPTFFNPNDTWLLGYWALLLLLQVGTALSLVLASGERTKALLTNGLSLSLPIANLSVAIWAPLFIIDQHASHIAGEVFLGIAFVGTLSSTLLLGMKASYSPTWRRPIEWIMVHLPLRLFLAVLLHADLWQQGIIAFGLADNGPHDLKKTIWPSFFIIVAVGVLSSLWIFATTDLALGLAGIYLQLSILFHPKITITENRPTELLAASILSISLQAIAIFTSLAWNKLSKRQEGRIALPIDEGIDQAEHEAQVAEQRARKRRQEAERLRRDNGQEGEGSEVTPSQLERGEQHHEEEAQEEEEVGNDSVNVTRKLGGGRH